MGVKSVTTYKGQLHCDLQHVPSKTVISTDAPVDNNGRGESFSPTDLVGAALVSCIITTMAMVAERDGHNIEGARGEVEKEMAANPRKIAKLTIAITLPARIPADYRPKLEAIGHTCPVARSLSPELQVPVTFIYV